MRQVAAGARASDVSRQGLSPGLLRHALQAAVPSSAEREEIHRLRTELRRVEQERDILHLLPPTSAVSRYTFIQQHACAWPLLQVCQVLEVSRTGYYHWRQRPPAAAPCWQGATQAASTRHTQRYGTRRLRAELAAEGQCVGRYALQGWLRREGLQALTIRVQQPRKTVADPAALVAGNRLLGQAAPLAPDQV